MTSAFKKANQKLFPFVKMVKNSEGVPIHLKMKKLLVLIQMYDYTSKRGHSEMKVFVLFPIQGPVV